MARTLTHGWCYACGRTEVSIRNGKYLRHKPKVFDSKLLEPCKGSGQPVRARHNVDIATR